MSYTYRRRSKEDSLQERLDALEQGYSSDDDLRVVEQQIIDLEKETGTELDPDSFQEVGSLVQRGHDPGTAFRLIVRQNKEAEAAWRAEVKQQWDVLEKDLGRKVGVRERQQIEDLMDDDPNVSQAWSAAFGQTYSEDEIKQAEASFQEEYDSLKEQGYSEEYLHAWAKEERPKYDTKVEQMRDSGQGEFPRWRTDNGERSQEYMAALLETEADLEPKTVAPLPENATRQEALAYQVARYEGAEVVEPEGEANDG